MANIKDVAKEAGVSIASVSRVLAERPGVGKKTRQRVMKAVQALDYRPNRAAQRLRSHRNDTIGLIVSDIRNPFFTEISRAVEDMAYQNRMRVILCNADEDPEKEALYLDLMRDEKVSGVILSPSLSILAHFRMSDYPFPVVLVDRCERETAADAVVLDNTDSAYRLTVHLIDQGYQRILFIYDATSATGRQRHQGYVTAMATHGLEIQVKVVPTPVRATVNVTHAIVSELVQGKILPDALIGSNGLILLGIIKALREVQLQFPEQIALAGFDDSPWTQLQGPGITVIAQPVYDIGKVATELLLQRIAHPSQPVRRMVLPGELRERGSTRAQRMDVIMD
ncbi:MAG: LacI family DNA-binding transcriptional regulator [Candidatus Competibacteraceae bacterium]|nr:LacI family DNA-binding transcriptional regulator [Candidatus Competibacteraceae bacterium]MCP5126549.1 LacI family DNA-binding transcriptional regulator [Gammaproteobacteria bacterium]